MTLYQSLESAYNTVKNNPFKTIGFALSLFCAYHIGKWERGREPLVEKIVLTADQNCDELGPDCAIQFLNGRREAGYMQKDGSTFLTYPGMLKGYEAREKLLNGPSKSDKDIKETPVNPIDSPVKFKDYCPKTDQKPSTAPATFAPQVPTNQQNNYPIVPERTASNSNNLELEQRAESDFLPQRPLVPVHLN